MKELIKFKTMAEILLTEQCYFDNYGNLCVNTITPRGGPDHLSPSYFQDLGKLREFKGQVHFPHWCVEYKTGNTFPLEKGLEAIRDTVDKNDREIVDSALEGKLIIRRVN